MEDIIFRYAGEYESYEDKGTQSFDKSGAAHNPVVFLFIGDKVMESVSRIKEEISRRWNNSNGLIYFYVYSDKGIGGEEMFSLKIEHLSSDIKTYRRSLRGQFYGSEGLLIELNQKLRQVKNKLFEYGSTYSCFEKINISVVTRSDDPVNILVPEITLLFKAKLAEEFKMVSTDMYTLFTERGDDDNFGYTSAVSVAFFREIEWFQQRDFVFDEPLEVLKEGIRLPITNKGVPIFDLIYLLSDRNEDGVIQENSMIRNYMTIALTTFLKNRSADAGWDSDGNDSYNNEHFRKNISVDLERQSYATAGMSEVRRPNIAIAITVLYHYYRLYIEKLKQNIEREKEEIFHLIQLDDHSLDNRVKECMPRDNIADEMAALMSTNTSFSQLEGMTYLEAEVKLYGDNCKRFFDDNYEKAASNRAGEMPVEDDLLTFLQKQVVENPKYGPYSAFMWTSQDYIMDEAGRILKDIQKQIEKLNDRLSSIYKQRVSPPPVRMLMFGQKAALNNVKKDVIAKIYSCKLEITALNIKLIIVRKIENALEKFHNRIKNEVEELDNLEAFLKDMQRKSIVAADGYLNQNIDEYYKGAVDAVMKEIADKWGAFFYFDERFVGPVFKADNIVKKLIDNCKRYILNHPRFNESFEDELLHRANMVSEYGDKSILSQEELFNNLYKILERNAKVGIYIINFAAKHRYEEKYFFGNYNSTFIRYAMCADESIRNYRLGCINENAVSGIQKLNLMGGFTIDSVVYARNCFRYYDKYKSEGYELHGISEAQLPVVQFNIP